MKKHGLFRISLATTHSQFFSLAPGKNLARSRSPCFSLATACSHFRFGVYLGATPEPLPKLGGHLTAQKEKGKGEGNEMEVWSSIHCHAGRAIMWWMGAPVKCGCADMRIFKVVKCGEILWILSADVMGKMWMLQCGYATNERMPIAYLHCTFALNILLFVLHG